MVTRRNLLAGAPAAALLSPLVMVQGEATQAQTQPTGPFRFGVITDPQYAPVIPRGTRYYANSLWKLDAAIQELNAQEDLAFVVTLGDIIDRHWESWSHILPVYDRLAHKHYFVTGNHDYDYPAEWLPAAHRTLGIERPYYDFAVGGVRFVVVDGNDVSTYAPPVDDPRREVAAERLAELEATGAPNAQSWNGSVGEEQMAWLRRTLGAARDAGERVMMFCHFPIHPPDQHNLWNSEELVELITEHPNVLSWFNGHNHVGNYGVIGNQHFVNFRGMVETPDTTAYAIVTVHEDRVEIEGFGREESRTLGLTAT